MKAYLFLHFEPSDEQIAIRGLESKINNFTKKNKKRKYDQFQLYRIANDFNQNQISVKLIEITPEFMDLIQSFPSVLYNHALMRNIKKISLTKALKLEKNDYEKQNKFTQEIVNGIIWLFITFCSEVSWNKVKNRFSTFLKFKNIIGIEILKVNKMKIYKQFKNWNPTHFCYLLLFL